MVLVRKKDVFGLGSHSVNAGLYLHNASYGTAAGNLNARREKLWSLLSHGHDVEEARVYGELWKALVVFKYDWRAPDLRDVRVRIQRELEEWIPEEDERDAPLASPSVSGPSQSGADQNGADDDVEMEEDDLPLAQRLAKRVAAVKTTAPKLPLGAEPQPKKRHGRHPEKSSSQEDVAPLQSLRGDLHRLFPILEQLAATLSIVQKGIAEDRENGVPSAVVRHAAKVDSALQSAKAVCAGISAEKVRTAIAHAQTLPQQQRRPAGQPDRPSAPRSWRDVVASSPPRKAPLEWDGRRTVLLRPRDDAMVRTAVSTYEFGLALRCQFPQGGSDDALFRIDKCVRLSTGSFKVQLADAAYDMIKSEKTVELPPWGVWDIGVDVLTQGPSLVVTGVPEGLSEQDVKEQIVEGTSPNVPEGAQAHLQAIKIQRLNKKVREDPLARKGRDSPQGARKGASPTSPEFVTSRCCRMFASKELIDHILAKGRINLRWAVLSVRPYNPPVFWCATCAKRGSHSTRFHRQTLTSQHA